MKPSPKEDLVHSIVRSGGARAAALGTAVAAALLAGSLGSGTAATAATRSATTLHAMAAACIPEAPVCLELRGTVGAYRLWFRIRPAVPPSALVFTVNGARAAGSLTTRTVGGVLEGEFRPRVRLVTGDRSCLRVSGDVRQYCVTTP
jgi:hypothetical protein